MEGLAHLSSARQDLIPSPSCRMLSQWVTSLPIMVGEFRWMKAVELRKGTIRTPFRTSETQSFFRGTFLTSGHIQSQSRSTPSPSPRPGSPVLARWACWLGASGAVARPDRTQGARSRRSVFRVTSHSGPRGPLWLFLCAERSLKDHNVGRQDSRLFPHARGSLGTASPTFRRPHPRPAGDSQPCPTPAR